MAVADPAFIYTSYIQGEKAPQSEHILKHSQFLVALPTPPPPTPSAAISRKPTKMAGGNFGSVIFSTLGHI